MVNLTQIQLIGDGINSQQGFLDLTEETIVPITYSVGDIRDISKKNGSFSKSIKIKGTKNNNILLNHYFDVNIVAGTFDINKVQPCVVFQNGVSVLPNAVLQLIAVDKVQTTNSYDEQTEYTILVKDTASDFYNIINNRYLEDLDLEIGEHTFTSTAITQSFKNTFVDGFKYITPYNPDVSTSPDDNSYNLEEFKPAIYARTYFDAIFYNAGYSYKWDSQNDPTIQFNKLLIPYNAGEVKDTDVTSATKADVGSSGAVSGQSFNLTGLDTRYATKFQFFKPDITYLTKSPINRIRMDVENSDTGNNFNPITYEYTNPNLPSNQNTITFDVTYQWKVEFLNLEVSQTLFYSPYDFNNGNNYSVAGDLLLKPTVFVRDNIGVIYDKAILGGQGITIKKNTSYPVGTTLVTGGTFNYKHTVPNLTVPKSFTLNTQFLVEMINARYGDSLNVFRTAGNVDSDQYRFRLTIEKVSTKIDSNVMGTWGYNSKISFFNGTINPFAPKKIKQSEFVKSLFTMFNLFSEVDKDNPKQINIFKRDDYYDSGKQKDWTHKIDKQENQQILFLPELINKKMLLTYKEDDDIANKIYTDSTGEIYGQQEFVFDNNYVRGIAKTEIIFSPTPCFNTSFDAVCPMLNGSAPDTNIRILYDGGELPCKTYTINNYSVTKDNVTTDYKQSATTYSFANHWDRPVNPTYDLNFGICDFYFRTDNFGNNTNNTLYNMHWRRTLNQINNGKMLTAKFNLTETDIYDLRLNDKIFINNSWWNINQIKDYDANSRETVTVELISIDDFLQLPFTERKVSTLTPSSPTFTIPIGGLINIRNPFLNWNTGTSIIPIRGKFNYTSPLAKDSLILGDFNSIGGGRGIIFGTNNQVNDDAFVYGSDNVIPARAFVIGSSNIIADNASDGNIVLGSGNFIGSGINNSFVFGSNLTATTSNTTYFENIFIGSGGTINGITIDAYKGGYNDTGVIRYTGITLASSTSINVPPIDAWFVDNETNPLQPTKELINYTGATNVTVPTLSAGFATYIFLKKDKTLFFQNSFPTSADRKAMCFLGKLGHPQGVINVGLNSPDFATSPNAQTRDLWKAFGFVNRGVIVTPLSGLTIGRSAGTLFGNGVSFHLTPTIPNEFFVTAQTASQIFYRTQTGGTTSAVSVLDPANYDVGGVITPIGGGANTTTIQYVFAVPGAQQYVIQYGQNAYAQFADAVAAVGKESFVQFQSLVHNGVLLGVIVAWKSGTNVLDPTHFRFFNSDIFGQLVGSAGGSPTTNLQGAYNNSGNPEIVENSTLRQINIRGWDNAQPIMEFENTTGGTVSTIMGNGNYTGSFGILKGTGTTSNANLFLGLNAGLNSTGTTGSIGIGTTALQNLTTGSSNVGIGNSVFNNLTTGSHNVAVGRSALAATFTTTGNTAIGSFALSQMLNASNDNIAIGRDCATQDSLTNTLSQTNQSIFIGNSVKPQLNNQTNQIIIGYNANGNGSNTVTIGNTSITNNYFTGDVSAKTINAITVSRGGGENNFNVAVGFEALSANTSAVANTAIGYRALTNNNAGQNTALGFQALQNNTIGNSNIAIGFNAQGIGLSGSSNVAIGTTAMFQNLGNENVGVGVSAIANLANGTGNTAVGAAALLGLQGTQTGNTALGWYAGRYVVGTGTTQNGAINDSIFIGANSRGLSGTSNAIVIGTNANGIGANNTVIGSTATTATTVYGYFYTTGTGSTLPVFNGAQIRVRDAFDIKGALNNQLFFGIDAGGSNTGGQVIGIGVNALKFNSDTANIAVGHNSQQSTKTGTGNVSVGNNTLFSQTNGDDNVVVGNIAMQGLLTGSSNTAIGSGSLFATTTGDGSVGVGTNSLGRIVSNQSNTALGAGAGHHLTNGINTLTAATNSIFIGRESRASANGINNVIVIGTNAVSSGSNSTVIGNSSVANATIFGALSATSIATFTGTSSQALISDGSTIALSAGTYLPVISGETNITGGVIINNSAATFTRIGNIVTVNIGFFFTPTTTGNTRFVASLPINKTNSATQNAGSGSANDNVNANIRSTVFGQVNAPNNINISWFVTSASGNQWVANCTFQYNLLT